jgi:hypothetical protein
VNSTARSWVDANKNYVPDCELTNFAFNGECGAIDNQNFGKINPAVNRWGEDAISGFAVREFNWDVSTEVQHQFTPRISASAGYYRNWHGNILATDNLIVTSADYDPYSVTAPIDPRLPNGGGYLVSGLYDVKQAKFGQVNNQVTHASNFGEPSRVNDFVNFSLNTRFAGGATLGGGVDTGRTVVDNCFVVDSPQQLLNCRVVTPPRGLSQYKLYGVYPLPHEFVVSFAYQNLAGIDILANYPATSAQIAPSLGRPLAGGARTATVPLLVPMTEFDDRVARLDLRATKKFRLTDKAALQLNLDAYNALNNSAVRSVNNSYGPAWLNALQVLDARILQFSASLTF